jgi:hypothetical protein
MCEESKRPRKFSDKEVISLFVKYLANENYPGFEVDIWPDEETRQSAGIDAIAGKFAIEHTSVDTIPNQRRDSAWFI